MKKTLGFLLILLATIFTVVQSPAQTPVPFDPDVRYGRLDNGLTYYIRANNLPENRAEFYLVQKVGAMQEEDDQNGLAHFLEHMAFSSTKNFPTGIVDGIEKYGAVMGPNINAYTATDQTVYYLSGIPLSTPGVIDTCLLVLHDWSSFIELKEEAIDKERDVITEEWRMRQGAGSRISEKQRPVIYKDSKYALRDIIGDMDIIRNFPYQTLHDYYNKWYRPDLQAVIVVGDFDVDDMESRIRTIMADLPKAVNPAERIYYPVPDNDEPLVVVTTDPEATSTSIQITYKQDAVPFELRNTFEALYMAHLQSFLGFMLNERLGEIGQQADSPYSYAGGFYGPFTITKDAWRLSASSKEGRLEETFRVLITENERIRRHGFTQGELDRAKANKFRYYEQSYNNRTSQQSGSLVRPLVDHFLTEQVTPGIAADYEMAKEIHNHINLDQVNRYIASIITDKNIIISASGPEKEGLAYPDEARLLAIMKEVQAENIEPKEEAEISQTLIAELPQPGKIISEEPGEHFGETVWTLSNGMKVLVKKTTFKDDEIFMSATAFGGLSLIDEKEWLNMNFISSVPSIGGAGDFSQLDLGKFMAGKQVGLTPWAQDYTSGIFGTSSKKDLETMLQLTHLYMTSPRKDVESFNAFKERVYNGLMNQKSNPNYIFARQVDETLYGADNLLTRWTDADDLENLDYDRMIELYRKMYENPGSFTFIFTGTVDEDELRPFVEQYLGSMPSGERNSTYKTVDKNIRPGKITNNFTQKMETPAANTTIVFSGRLERDPDTHLKVDVLNNVLHQLFFRTVRGDEGGAYGVGAGVGIDRIPSGRATLRISYSTNPERVEYLNSIIYREINNFAENGPRDDEYEKAIEAVVKDRTVAQIQNRHWSLVMENYYNFGEDEETGSLDRIRNVSKDDLRAIIRDLVSQGNVIEVVMTPEE